MSQGDLRISAGNGRYTAQREDACRGPRVITQGLIQEYRDQFIRIEALVEGVASESGSLERSSPAYRRVSRIIEANFLDKPLEDVAYLQETLSLKSDHSIIIILRELDAGIAALRKTGENILIASKELDRSARDKVDGFIHISRIAILIFFPLFLIVGVGSMLFIISNVVKRLQLLSDLAEKTGAGDFAHIQEPVPSWGRDEVGQLIRKFNDMEDQLSQREKELLQSRKLAAIAPWLRALPMN